MVVFYNGGGGFERFFFFETIFFFFGAKTRVMSEDPWQVRTDRIPNPRLDAILSTNIAADCDMG